MEAFHLYGGDINDLSELKNTHPDKNLYFTEQWVGAPGNLYGDLRWHIRNLIIGATRNWCKTIIEWNLASDENQKPHTEGGCSSCLGAVTITGNSVQRILLITLLHMPQNSFHRVLFDFIHPTLQLYQMYLLTPEEKIVTIVLNDSSNKINFNIILDGKDIHSSLNAGAIGTFVLN